MSQDNGIIMKSGGLWALRQMSWLVDRRNAKAADASMAAREFEKTADEIADRIYRDGPWPTAIRLTNPFTNRSQA